MKTLSYGFIRFKQNFSLKTVGSDYLFVHPFRVNLLFSIKFGDRTTHHSPPPKKQSKKEKTKQDKTKQKTTTTKQNKTK